MVKRVGLIIWWKNLNCFQRQEKEVDQKTVPYTDSYELETYTKRIGTK